jgi:hypothetical protein
VPGGDRSIFGIDDTLFTWVSPQTGLSGNLFPGSALFVAGLVGALFTMYLTDPERLPQLGGTQRLSRIGRNVDRARTAWVEEVAHLHATNTRLDDSQLRHLAELRDGLTELQRQFRLERRFAMIRGVPLFVFLAGILSLAVSRSLVEAVVIGAAWPAFLWGLGLKRENQELKEEAAEVSHEEILSHARECEDLRARCEAAETAFRRIVKDLIDRGVELPPGSDVSSDEGKS